jgi:hypothetical protein
MLQASQDHPLVTDYRKALMLASELRSVGAHEEALVWAQLATFLQQSEAYIFENSGSHMSLARWQPSPDQLEQ